MNQDDNEGGNAQMFADLRYKNARLKTMFYASLFVDEMSFSTLFENNGIDPTEAAYTLGMSILDLVLEGSKLTFEYTKINPYVYMHMDNSQTYANYTYQLGHWIGSNSDLIYSSYEQSVIRELKLKLWGEYIRKGKTEKSASDITFKPYPEFLYGQRITVFDLGANLSWEPYYSLIVMLNYQYSQVADKDKTRTPGYEIGNRSSLEMQFSYGL
jgi:mRNA-degrading endonuclease HigB of HigAB toxin-antitoxin module